ncbi:menaquinone biosynthesis protein [Desulfogranum mediterraneum]|uniref:menaquinone biosynthesis protein n=1 Tax=Desulfogranum mediterraneum TaxID=160661 RepID=UPI0004069979|nr:menaquinone biosynthesis protein [Desulfogranum mediterraneum]
MARIGMVNYINTAPIYEIWKELDCPADWNIVEGHPRVLNKMLAADQIDMGFVSSYEYAARPERYQILGDLSISATGPVGSVLLFSSLPPEELDKEEILLTGQSDTSVCLVRIILEEFYRVKPRYRVGDAYGAGDQEAPAAAVLAIGDDALRLRIEDRYPFQLDLSDLWHQRTGLPFVFSVCAIRQDFIDASPGVARAIRERFIDCRIQGGRRMAEICDRVARRIPMDCTMCSEYLNGIEHDLGDGKRRGLELFFELLINRKEASPAALPLKIFE